MRLRFQNFYRYYNNLSIEDTIEYFSIFGGVEELIEIDISPTLSQSISNNILKNFSQYSNIIAPSYLSKKPYRDVLIAIAKGDGRVSNILKRSHIYDSITKDILDELIELEILKEEYSREKPIKQHPKQKLKKHLRGYQIESKIRFVEPFYRFWFGFVEPFILEIEGNIYDNFIQYFELHHNRLMSLVFEQLSNEIINYKFETISSGSYWNRDSEFDILAVTTNKKIIIGECKYKNRKICKNELTKLQYKTTQNGINVNYYALFSKNGFSKELMKSRDKNLLLYTLDDFKEYLIKD